jgi:viroplasmin and RNaseH domain-containing protein
MIYTDLYNEVLIKPCREGADSLLIISGFASATMAYSHLKDLNEKKLKARINLLIGMCPSDGVSLSNHKGFQGIVNSSTRGFKNLFMCSYIYKPRSVHSKLYIWHKRDKIYKTYIGSANYTQNAFHRQREVMAEIKEQNVDKYIQMMIQDSVYCTNLEAEELVSVQNDANYYRQHIHEDNKTENISPFSPIKSVKVSLLSRKNGEVPERGGLNWGQRPGRNQNQAYLQLSPDVYRSDFFPIAPQWFIVHTDDFKYFFCRRAEKDQNGQTIHTPENNSLLGEYYRYRLGLASGAFVTRQHLEQYGRTDIDFTKIADDEFYMDFSV